MLINGLFVFFIPFGAVQKYHAGAFRLINADQDVYGQNAFNVSVFDKNAKTLTLTLQSTAASVNIDNKNRLAGERNEVVSKRKLLKKNS